MPGTKRAYSTPAICSIEGCHKVYSAMGYCRQHYTDYYYDRLPKGVSVLADPKTRYDRKIDKTDTCWIWTGSRDKRGYGRVNTGNGVIRLAHRIIYELYKGEIPQGLSLDHLCMNQPCVNPDHLEPVTHAENVRRAYVNKPTHCPQGHAYDKQNTYVNPIGRRVCRRCTNEAGKKYRERKKVEHEV